MSNHYDQDVSQPRRWHKPKKADEVPEGQLPLFDLEPVPVEPPTSQNHSVGIAPMPIFYVWKVEDQRVVQVSDGFDSWFSAEAHRIQLLHGWGMTLTLDQAMRHQAALNQQALTVSEQSDNQEKADQAEVTPEELQNYLDEWD